MWASTAGREGLTEESLLPPPQEKEEWKRMETTCGIFKESRFPVLFHMPEILALQSTSSEIWKVLECPRTRRKMPAVQILWGLAHSRECPDAGYTPSSRSPLSPSPPNSTRWKLHYQVTSERHKSGRCHLQFPPRGWQ